MPLLDMMSGGGNVILAVIALVSIDWKEFTNGIGLLTAVSAISILLMPESEMWIETSKTKRQASRSMIETLKDFARSVELIRATAILSLLFSSSQMALYGLSLSADSLVGSVTINYLILGSVDIVANIILIIIAKCIIRRHLLIASFAGLGISCIIAGVIRLVAADQAMVASFFFILGKFFASFSSSLVFLTGAEAFPTECRTIGMNIAQVVCRVMNVVLIIILQGNLILHILFIWDYFSI